MAYKNLKSLLEHLDAWEFVLSEIQRDFVWNRRNVLILSDSLYRNLPNAQLLDGRTDPYLPPGVPNQ